MRLCSAAWKVPRSFGICSRPSSRAGSGENQTASVSKVVSGMSSGTDIERRTVADRLACVGDDLLGDRYAPEVELDTEPLGCLDRLLDRRRRLFLHLRVPVDAGGADDCHAILERDGLDEVLLAEMEVDGALVHGRVTRGRAPRDPGAIPVSPSTTVNASASPERRDTRAAG